MANVHAFRNEPRPLDNRWCSECGEQTCAQCDCGVKFVGKGKFAEIAVKKHHGMSGHDLEKRYPGISRKTFDRAREKIGTNVPIVTKNGNPRQKPQLKVVPSDPVQEPCDDCDTHADRWQRSIENFAGDAVSMRAFWTKNFGKWEEFSVPSTTVTLARQAAEEWTKLVRELQSRRKGTNEA